MLKDEYDNLVTTADVERILRDSTYRAIMNKVREDQINAFVRSAATETANREEAHSILRALSKIEQAFKSILDDGAVKHKREIRHTNNGT